MMRSLALQLIATLMAQLANWFSKGLHRLIRFPHPEQLPFLFNAGNSD